MFVGDRKYDGFNFAGWRSGCGHYRCLLYSISVIEEWFKGPCVFVELLGITVKCRCRDRGLFAVLSSVRQGDIRLDEVSK